ncbi:MAG: NAD-dependent epimerase/dehydratase family protein [Bdellovibrionia bacterium]
MKLSGPLLITGASGFVGAHLCQHFLGKTEVVGVEGSNRGSWRLEYIRSIPQAKNSFRSIKVDLTSMQEVKKAVEDIRPTAILNCAAYGAYSSQTNADRIYQVNLDAARNLIEAARETSGFEAFIQAGSSSEYGLNCTAPSEESPTYPDSHYAVSKVAATQLVRFYGIKHGIPAWTFRLYSVYGPLEDASRLISKALLQSLHGKLPPLVNPKTSRDFIYVEDVSRAFEKALEHRGQLKKGEIFNIGTGVRTRLEDLVQTFIHDFGVQESPNWGTMENRPWDHADWYSNPSKAARELGWKAETSLSDGLRQTFEWLRSNPEWVKRSLENTVLVR